MNSRSAIYVVFMAPIDPNELRYLRQPQRNQTFALQYRGYALFAARTAGDQPGRPFKRYLTPWKSFPNGIFIATNKFSSQPYTIVANGIPKDVLPFEYDLFPFP